MPVDALGDAAAAVPKGYPAAVVAVGAVASTGLAAAVDEDGASDGTDADGAGDVVAVGVPQAANTTRAQAGMNARNSL